jgi:subtilase family serine protease
MAVTGLLVLAGGCGSAAGSAAAARPAGPAAEAGVPVTGAVAGCRRQTGAACYSPQQFRVAYGIRSLLDRGIDGRGQTVVLMEFAMTPDEPQQPVPVTDIRQDLVLFDTAFALPAARLQVDNSLADSATPWLASGEEVEDAEIVHAVAPAAGIRLILIPRQSSPGTWAAATDGVLGLALAQGSVISIGAGSPERCLTKAQLASLNSALAAAQARHLTVVGSTGDLGAATLSCSGGLPSVKDVELPAADPLVLAVGGTSLAANRETGVYISETAWKTTSTAGPTAQPGPGPSAGPAGSGPAAGPAGSGPAQPGAGSPGVIQEASGGGYSTVFPRPAYQDGVTGAGPGRGVPDVAADADPATGMTLAAREADGTPFFFSASGTSAAGPFWAALIALADQDAGRHLGFVNPAIYRIGRSAGYHQAFHDITTGNNTVRSSVQTVIGYQAAPGWDPVTGWGSPDAQVLIPLLVRYASS